MFWYQNLFHLVIHIYIQLDLVLLSRCALQPSSIWPVAFSSPGAVFKILHHQTLEHLSFEFCLCAYRLFHSFSANNSSFGIQSHSVVIDTSSNAQDIKSFGKLMEMKCIKPVDTTIVDRFVKNKCRVVLDARIQFLFVLIESFLA